MTAVSANSDPNSRSWRREAVAAFDAFTTDNDPYGEHDFFRTWRSSMFDEQQRLIAARPADIDGPRWLSTTLRYANVEAQEKVVDLI